MASLDLTYGEVYSQVSDFLGMGLTPAGANLTRVQAITLRAYRKFLMPINPATGKLHVWSFLKQEQTLTTSSGQYEYELPHDFGYFVFGPKYGADSQYPNPIPVSLQQIRTMRSAYTSSSYPIYWSLKTMRYSLETGTQYGFVFHPPADSDYDLHYSYVIVPDKPIVTGDYFIGGPLASEVILQTALGEAELQEDDTPGPNANEANIVLNKLIQMDLQKVPDSVGKNLDHQFMLNSPALARELRYYGAPSEVYGVS